MQIFFALLINNKNIMQYHPQCQNKTHTGSNKGHKKVRSNAQLVKVKNMSFVNNNTIQYNTLKTYIARLYKKCPGALITLKIYKT